MLLSEMLNSINNLPDSDDYTREVISKEIEALKNFSDDERHRIFNSADILFLIQTYTIKQLKESANKAIQPKDVSVGDTVTLQDGTRGVVLEVLGTYKDRLTILYSKDGYTRVKDSVSAYDIEVVGNLSGVNDIMRFIKQ